MDAPENMLAQVRGDDLLSGYVAFPPSMFRSSRTLPDPTLTYALVGPSGANISDAGISFDASRLTVVGKFPRNMPLATSQTVYDMTLTATNVCGYALSLPWSISTFPLLEPVRLLSIAFGVCSRRMCHLFHVHVVFQCPHTPGCHFDIHVCQYDGLDYWLDRDAGRVHL